MTNIIPICVLIPSSVSWIDLWGRLNVFKHQHHHEEVNEGTGGCAFKQMVLIRSVHTQCTAQMVSRANVCQTGFQLVQTVKSAIWKLCPEL